MKINEDLLNSIIKNKQRDLSYEDVIEIIKDLSDRGYPSYKKAKQIAIAALEELNLYEQGGVCLIPSDVYKKQCEELDRLKEMTNPEKPVILEYKLLTDMGWIYGCPNCGSAIGVNKYYTDITQLDDWCPTCGKDIDWS